MAIEAYKPDTPGGRGWRPIDDHGKLRYMYSKFTVGVQGDIGSTFLICTLPPGTVRLLPLASWIGKSAWGSARTLAVGYGAYRTKQDVAAANDGIVAASANAFAAALDMAALGVLALNTGMMKYDMASVAGVPIVGTLAGGTVPADATLEALIAYLYE